MSINKVLGVTVISMDELLAVVNILKQGGESERLHPQIESFLQENTTVTDIEGIVRNGNIWYLSDDFEYLTADDIIDFDEFVRAWFGNTTTFSSTFHRKSLITKDEDYVYRTDERVYLSPALPDDPDNPEAGTWFMESCINLKDKGDMRGVTFKKRIVSANTRCGKFLPNGKAALDTKPLGDIEYELNIPLMWFNTLGIDQSYKLSVLNIKDDFTQDTLEARGDELCPA